MARTGTRPTPGKVTGSDQTAAQQTYVDEKAIAPGLNDALPTAKKFDDEYYPDPRTISANETWTVDTTNEGNGNGFSEIITASGTPTLTLTGFTIRKRLISTETGQTVTLEDGHEYTIFSIKRGALYDLYVVDNAGTSASQTLSTPTLTATAQEGAVRLVVTDEDPAQTGRVLLRNTVNDEGTASAVAGYDDSADYIDDNDGAGLVNGTEYFYFFYNTADGYNNSNTATDSATPAALVITQSISGNNSDSWLLESSRRVNIEPVAGSTKTWAWWQYGDSGEGSTYPWGIGNEAGVDARGRSLLSFWIDENHATLANILRLSIFENTNIYRQIQSSVAITREAWHLIAVTYAESTNTMQLYVDKVLDSSATRNDAGTFATYNGQSENRLAVMGIHDVNGTVVTSAFKGEINNYSVWDKVLSLSEIEELAVGTRPADLDNHSALADRIAWLRFNGDLTDEDSYISGLVNTNCVFDNNVPS